MIITLYNKDYKLEWDSFIYKAKNGHFFFLRDYLEYHSDRFEDFSFLIFNDDHELVAVMPANRNGNVLYSHQGLSFGGIITNYKMNTPMMLNIFKELLFVLKKNDIKKLIYKAIPHIYHKFPAEEDLYALFRVNSRLIRRDVSTTIDLSRGFKFQERRLRAIKKAMKNNVLVNETENIDGYWKILNEVLHQKYSTSSVHTLEEICYLKSKFPDNIKLFTSSFQGEIVAGTLIFENDTICHTQYLAASEIGKKIGALDLVISKLIFDKYRNKKYFDFGISTENGGLLLNEGLISQKEGFGGRAITYDFYEVEIND